MLIATAGWAVLINKLIQTTPYKLIWAVFKVDLINLVYRGEQSLLVAFYLLVVFRSTC